QARPVDAYRAAFERGLGFIFASQYPNGCWPQRFPLEDNYGKCITFNDDVMTNVMRLLRDIADGRPPFSFISADERRKCREAFDRGVDCILACQIRIDGKPTAWCQQYDPKTLEPAAGRAYEFPGLSGRESAGVL